MSEKTLVMKFGGASLGTPEAIVQVANIVRQVRQDWPRVVVITSALAGVTNLLLESALLAARGDTRLFTQASHQFYSMHSDAVQALLPDPTHQAQVRHEVNLLINEFTNLCRAISILGEVTPRAMDTIAAIGERMSVRVLAAVLQSQGVPAPFIEATRLIVTDENFQNAHPDLAATTRLARQSLEPLLEAGQVPVVTGAIAATSNGTVTTLGRNGSDYTAALIGAALPADEVWIWTEVDGVMTSDPRLVNEARSIERLSYREISELAYFGAKVLHPKTIRPVIDAGITLRVRNTFNPAHLGTVIVPDADPSGSSNIKAVTTIRNHRLITIEGHGMLGVPGIAARAFGAVAAAGISIPFITQASSEQAICFAVPDESTVQVIQAIEKVFELELQHQDIDRIWASNEVMIITVVGAGMRDTPGVGGRIFTMLGEKRINVIAIAQGSSEVSVSLVVDAKEAEDAVTALHDLVVQQH